MYIETSSPRSKGHKAWLVSPQYKSTNGRCLQFWYHMYGTTIGGLNVLFLQNGTRTSPIWSLSGNQGNLWRMAQVTLKNLVDFKVSVQFSFHNNYLNHVSRAGVVKASCLLDDEFIFDYALLQVIFEGVTGTSYSGDIAIDDVEIMDGACPRPGMQTN